MPTTTRPGLPPYLGLFRSRYFWIFLVALALRLELVFVCQTYAFSPFHDHYAFGFETGSIARAIATGEGFSSPFGGHTGPTAWIGPLYPLFCAVVFRIFGVFSLSSAIIILGINCIFAALNAVLLLNLGRKIVGELGARVAAWTWALLLPLMQWPAEWVWETSLSALLATLAIMFTILLGKKENVSQKSAILYGLFWGVSVLANPALLSIALCCGLWLLRKTKPHRIRNITMVLATGLFVITPWLVRNQRQFHHFVFIRGNFGFEFRLGNFPGSTGMGWSGYHPANNDFQLKRYTKLGEIEYVRETGREAVRWVREYPGDFLRVTGRRIRVFWDGDSLRYWAHSFEDWDPVVFELSSIFSLAGLLIALHRRLFAAGLLFSVAVVYPMPYYLTYVHPRYRHAIEPVLALGFGMFVTLLVDLANQSYDKFRE